VYTLGGVTEGAEGVVSPGHTRRGGAEEPH